MDAPKVVASTVSIPAELVLHTDIVPCLFLRPASSILRPVLPVVVVVVDVVVVVVAVVAAVDSNRRDYCVTIS